MCFNVTNCPTGLAGVFLGTLIENSTVDRTEFARTHAVYDGDLVWSWREEQNRLSNASYYQQAPGG